MLMIPAGLTDLLSVTRAVPVLRGVDAYPAAPHLRQPRHQRELGPRRQGRHGDDAQPDSAGGHALQALMRGSGRYGKWGPFIQE